MSVESGHHGTNGSIERTSTVETEPSKDDENSADEDQSGVVRFVGLVVVLGCSLAEHQGVCKSCPSTGDVDGATTGIVERGQFEEPAVRVPCPACDGAVDYSAPAESKDEGRDDATTLE